MSRRGVSSRSICTTNSSLYPSISLLKNKEVVRIDAASRDPIYKTLIYNSHLYLLDTAFMDMTAGYFAISDKRCCSGKYWPDSFFVKSFLQTKSTFMDLQILVLSPSIVILRHYETNSFSYIRSWQQYAGHFGHRAP